MELINFPNVMKDVTQIQLQLKIMSYDDQYDFGESICTANQVNTYSLRSYTKEINLEKLVKSCRKLISN